MEAPSGRILADSNLPPGKQLYNNNGEIILIYQAPNPQTKQLEWKGINRAMFSQLSGVPGYPPLVRLVERGKSGKVNLGFCYLWVEAGTGLIQWRIGELAENRSFENISWKAYSQVPGVKNKNLGSQGSTEAQGNFEGARRWVEFLEKKKYKLLFPGDEAVANQVYFARATEPEMLTSNFQIPEAMLAENFNEAWLPKNEVIIQPKYDGKRNLSGWQEGKVIMASRGRKQAKGNHPHLLQQLTVVFQVIQEKFNILGNPTCPIWLDGELFVFGASFQTVMSATQSSINENELSKQISYIIYDAIDNGTTPQVDRLKFLEMIFADPRIKSLPNIKLSPWYLIQDLTTLPEFHRYFVAMGNEGAIVRDPKALYVQKRTRALLKMKNWQREEWYIVGAEEATGFHAGCVVWVLNSRPDGQGLTCKGCPVGGEIGTLDSRRSQWQNRHLFIKNPPVVATIEFFEKSRDGVPRFPGVIAYNRTDF